MKNISEFQIIGRLGAIKKVGSTTRITIAANYPYKNDSGAWVEDAHWNELVVFSKNIVAYIEKHLNPGDLVHARGRIRQNNYQRDGETVYSVDLICNDFSRLAQASQNREDHDESQDA